ncbi:MAG: glutamate synthase large subunit [Candidatus Hydrogenedentes bacterium]|nr:glutamate synthase large subunit [Candidatus Hydrogenedentota bacterium]
MQQDQNQKEKGLYDQRFEHDSCGVGFIVNIDATKSHSIVEDGIKILINLTHRGACGCDPQTGDGCGIMFQLPDEFFRETLRFSLPKPGEYAVGMLFLPKDTTLRNICKEIISATVAEEGQKVLGWRDVPVNPNYIGWLAKTSEPHIEQIFIKSQNNPDNEAFERKLFIIRKVASRKIRNLLGDRKNEFYIPSLSSRTIVYKGLFLPEVMCKYYLDLQDRRIISAFAIVHQRYSTNTLPSWSLAQPFRFIAHNGEINTLRGNINFMSSREYSLSSELFGENIKKIIPVLTEGASDSAIFDNAFELLLRGGRTPAHAIAMMIPEPWGNGKISEQKKAFYEFYACKIEPWDGPACIAFTDGVQIGAVLDRNGLRPARYWITSDNKVILASEVGVLDIPEEKIIKKWRLQPGKMFLIDLKEKRIIDDEEIKTNLSTRRPYREWLSLYRLSLPLKNENYNEKLKPLETSSIVKIQKALGYTEEDIELIMKPMVERGEEPVGSMGNDTPLAVLSDRPQPLFNYFKQLFAQVTNPPLDSIREKIVMSLETDIGREGNLLDESPLDCRMIHLKSPILTNSQLQYISKLKEEGFKARTISLLFPIEEGEEGFVNALDRICMESEDCVDNGVSILILSDRGITEKYASIPSLLAVGAVHHHLLRKHKRTLCGIVVESGEPREVMHFALLIGYGAGGINPYLAFETIEKLVEEGKVKISLEEAIKNYIKAIDKGILKIMSKMGISTLQSYRGAQIFEAIGLGREVIDRCFSGTPSRIGGIELRDIAKETLMKHEMSFAPFKYREDTLDPGGQYRWLRQGEFHQWNPNTVAKLQHAVILNRWDKYLEYTEEVNDPRKTFATIRNLLRFKRGNPVPLDEVEPASEIVKRFRTGAMSYGSISLEAHQTLAIAMNRIGGRSNSGEGGEDPIRYIPEPNGDNKSSAIKQVAQARFGVTNEYLVNAKELQIKIAQGAKPGEGGQLPSHKVYPHIAKVRHSTPYVELISPPPHHDIYSIEDLAQLIYDLKNANKYADVSVKLVAEIGVGTVAVGVSKGKAEVVVISGHDGGTGASPLSSIKHAGLPWELGIAETHQTLVQNNLRDRIRVQVDGQLKTGRDVVIAALLGAEEFGFATSALISLGCVMMRKCHSDTCPVGIATQNPELRKKFAGKPEYVINFMFFIAEDVRRIMAELGFRKFEEMIGRVDMLEVRPDIEHWKAKKLDLSPLLMPAKPWEGSTPYCSKPQEHGLEKALDNILLEKARPALENKEPVRFSVNIKNINRTFGTMLSSELTRRHKLGVFNGELPEDLIWIDVYGVAGQSFGAFAIKGVTLNLIGEANDYIGKGLSGGKIIVTPPSSSKIVPEKNIIIGNVSFYGATSGEAYIRGIAGERFCVRNSGAWVVVEGIGDHGCEYMTGGRAVVLGETGKNFAGGMTGGIAFVYDPDGKFHSNCNTETVELKPLHEKSIPELIYLLKRHWTYTGSSTAKKILDNLEREISNFIRVMPINYAKVLKELNYVNNHLETPLETISK